MHASPIRIGYCLSLTGALAGNGQSARLAHEIWTACDFQEEKLIREVSTGLDAVSAASAKKRDCPQGRK